MSRRILVVDDEQGIRAALGKLLEYEGYEVRAVSNATDGITEYQKWKPDLVLMDAEMAGMDGLEALKRLRELDSAATVVMISGHATIRTAVEATQLGAYKILEKPLDTDRILVMLRNALAHLDVREENSHLGDVSTTPYEIVGDSRAMRALVERIKKVGATRAPVLITGENGTGKEAVARALHRHSPRAGRPFVEVNCAAIPGELIERELFGQNHPFTGDRAGKFEQANGGTLFLDEIGEVSLAAQAKVLRVLQDSVITRVGSAKAISVNVRVIAATNKNLEAEIAAGKFRDDLYYRLNVAPIHVPPLREHREDIPTLIAHFPSVLWEREGVTTRRMSTDALERLKSLDWPGNVRELRNTVERLLIQDSGPDITAKDVDLLADTRAAGRRRRTRTIDPAVPPPGRAPNRAIVRVENIPKKPGVIQRTPHIDLPRGTLGPGDSFTVEVYVDTKKPLAGETSKALKIEKRPDRETYLVDVWMAGSSHFIVDEPKAGVLTLDVRRNKSEPVPFKVRVADKIKDPAGAVLFAYFTYQGRPSGQVRRRVKLTPSKPAAGAAGAAGAPPPRTPATGFRIARGVPSADLTVEITDPERTCLRLKCRVSSRLLKPEEQPRPENWYLKKQSGALVKGYMKEFVNDENHKAYSLIGAGTRLYEAAPESFKKLLWDLIDRGTPPASILITSEEPNIPWELMVPFRKGKDGAREALAALGVEFKVGRWTRDDHQSPPPTVPLKDSYVIAPTYNTEPAPLKKSAEEVTLVLAAVPGAKVDPADLANIKKQLSASGRSLLHFVCHGADADESDVQAIFLDGGKERLTSLEVTAVPAIVQAFKKRPMVFLNACEVGRATVALTGIGGFAAAFLDLGAAAVIAPLWSVKDTIAYEVARKFYQAAVTPPPGVERKGFAEIMREIRALAYDEATGEDTYAAYCFYGDPNASAD